MKKIIVFVLIIIAGIITTATIGHLNGKNSIRKLEVSKIEKIQLVSGTITINLGEEETEKIVSFLNQREIGEKLGKEKYPSMGNISSCGIHITLKTHRKLTIATGTTEISINGVRYQTEYDDRLSLFVNERLNDEIELRKRKN
jgi:hypothetical protein